MLNCGDMPAVACDHVFSPSPEGITDDTGSRDKKDKGHVEMTSLECLHPADLEASLPPPPVFADTQTNQPFGLVEVRFLTVVIEDIQTQYSNT